MARQTFEEFAASKGMTGMGGAWYDPSKYVAGYSYENSAENGGTQYVDESYGEDQTADLKGKYSWYNQQEDATALGGDASSIVDVEALKADPTNVLGALTRAQYLSEKAMFEPIEDRLRNMTTYESPEKTALSINDAIGSNGYVNKALDNSYNQGQRQTSRYGMALNARQQESVDSNAAMKRSTSVVDAANRIRQRLVSRNEQIMLGGSPADPRATTTTGGAA
jgi:hypothetical protein